MTEKKFLPVGSVVLLKDGLHRVMVIGFCPLVEKDGKDIVCDYFGCFYPEGLFGAEQLMAFNHKDIVKISSVGFSDEEDKEFRSKLDSMVDENGNVNIDAEKLFERLVKEVDSKNE